MDYEKLTKDIVELSGGASNIKSVTHCATRLRFFLNDESKADKDAIAGLKGVLGCIFATGQLQIILGKDLLPVYDCVVKNYHFASDNAEAPKVKESPVDTVINFIAGAVAPLVPGLIGGGMLKVFLFLITYFSPAFAQTNANMILGWVANAPFYFMPIFVAYGAAVKLGATPIYAMAGAASLLTPAFTTMVAEGTPLTLLGLPVRLVNYPQQLVPALLITLAAYYIEKFLNKVVPGIFKSIFVGAGTMALSMILGFTILGPLGGYVGSMISGVFVFLGNTVGPIAVAVLAACLPWLVMTGMHHAISPFMAQSIANPGYDPIFRPAYILHNMSEGGACLGVALRTKDPEFRSEAFSLAFGCIVAGVTEPAIYGVNFRLKKPMLGVMAGGAVGGVVTGLLGARAYAMGYSTIMALPIFQDTMMAMAIGIATAIVTAAIVTYILGFEENLPAKTAEPVKDSKDVTAPVNGEMIDITTVNDETFAGKILGEGTAFIPADGMIKAPCDGIVEMIADTGHAFAITRDDELNLLVHVGIDTVELNGEGFRTLVQKGAHVKAGDPVIQADLNLIKNKGYDPTVMLIVTEGEVSFTSYGQKKAGESIQA